ncbi:hypothetical protein W911_09105 [Hyphomicrobium nitrativorans NL23]|uniref:Uncharacterized protein n=1 Tax=Hyphomicrobium nitrativorans NL23 TaxID=1029756 RepID=V5SJ72_9HYPH|nr:hypothetical protein [Hyphomicrobium nitrativorans]AHB50140.1 hypothetical protein W911_09105 [Hyphomicrobium nitrativorans NL23]
MNIRVKTDALPAENGHKKFDRVLAALGLQAAMPKAATSIPGDHWVASWRFCQN